MLFEGKVNKKTLILLLIAVIIWVVAIFILIRMNSPSPQPAQQTVQQSVSTPSTQGIQNQTPDSGFNPTENSSQVIAQNLSIVEIQNMIPESTFTDMFKPYLLEIKFDKGAMGVSNFLSSSIKGTKADFGEIEDISTAEFEYIGYLSLSDTGGKKRRKVYIRQGTDTKSFYDTEMIDNRYKIIEVREFEIVLLDTYDGKIKKLSNLLAKQ
ncbi:hypothetical protein [Fervidobacterium sp. 2310opik-2]|uniref:hypothetical protein n=1 Tax=Fervidobacterium sp. 2310opik-2 TaxID=1755815 RepID=UPI0013DEECD6|nr:hypothetical protein [Fervidobacterium sp. 2310opik-2]KAF2961336.1 hypothetical protein AS161_09145 [Fervidobacterium sp. 2310opik-2]